MSLNSLLCNHTRFKRSVYLTEEDHVSMVLTAKRNYSENGSEDDVTTLQSKEHVVAYTVTAEPFHMVNGDLKTRYAYQDLKAKRLEQDIPFEPLCIERTDHSCIYHFNDFFIEFKVYNEKPNGHLNGQLVSERLLDIPNEILIYLAGFNNPFDRYNLLPAGFGWDGVRTGMELNTARKIQQLMIGDYIWEGIDEGLITTIQEASTYTPASMMKLNWSNATTIGKNEEIDIGKRNFNSKIYIIGQNSKLSKLLCVDSDIKTFKLPDEFDRCIVIKTNMIKTPKQTYGVCIELYKQV